MYHIYWLHYKEHRDPNKEGYIGLTKNITRRHKEYFKSKSKKHNHLLTEAFKNDEVIMDIIFSGTKDECRKKELELRPTSKIGWNVSPGGMIPPDVTGRKDSTETRLKKSINNVGFSGRKHSTKSKLKMSESRKGQIPHNRKKVHTPDGVFISTKDAGIHYGIPAGTIQYRAKSGLSKHSDFYYIEDI